MSRLSRRSLTRRFLAGFAHIGADAPVRLKLTTVIWNPEQVLGTADNRELGVMVDRVEVR